MAFEIGNHPKSEFKKGHKKSSKSFKFPKGHKINNGRKHTEEQNENQSKIAKKLGFGKWAIGNKNRLGKKGNKLSDKTKRKIGLASKGNKYRLGHKHSEVTKQKMSEAHKGEKSYLWKGGISKNPYPREFNYVLKLKIRTRDNFTCCLCGKTEREELEELNRVLCVNHIDFDKNNCKEENLNTLCLRCNVKINREREYWKDYFQKIELN